MLCSSPQSDLAHVRRLLKHFSCRCFFMMLTTDDLGMPDPRDISRLCCEFGAGPLDSEPYRSPVSVSIRADTSQSALTSVHCACVSELLGQPVDATSTCLCYFSSTLWPEILSSTVSHYIPSTDMIYFTVWLIFEHVAKFNWVPFGDPRVHEENVNFQRVRQKVKTHNKISENHTKTDKMHFRPGVSGRKTCNFWTTIFKSDSLSNRWQSQLSSVGKDGVQKIQSA